MELFYYCVSFTTFLLCLLVHHCMFKKPKLLPPGPWQLPIIGSSHHLLSGSKIPQRKLWDMARAYGPLMYVKLGQLHTVVVSSARAAEEMFTTHDLQLSDKPDNAALDIITYDKKDIATTPYGEYWRQMRKICVVELLSAKRVQSFKSVREEEAANLIRSIRSADRAATINLTDKLRTFTTSVICRAAFGRRQAEAKEFIAVFDEVKKLVVAMDPADFFPSWGFVGLVSGVKRKAWGLRRRFDCIFEKIIQEHKQRRTSTTMAADGDDEEDLVDILLRIEDQGGLQFPLTNDHVKATIFDIFAGGSDTGTVLMDWAMTELMRNPRVMMKATEEVREVLKGKKEVTEEGIQELHYLKSVVKETLRLHPSIPLYSRKCREACDAGGYHLPKDTNVIINAWALGRDSEFWDEPEAFRPERFQSPGNTISFSGGNYAFMPFGTGRRICPGILFGTVAVELVLTQLLYYFDWKLPHGISPEDLDMTEVAKSGWNRVEDLFVSAIPHRLE